MSKIVINFYANVSEPTARDLMGFVMQSLAQQNPSDPVDEVIIQIASSGGSSDHGLLLYNFFRQLSVKKTTIGMGNVDSAAVMLFLAGDKRLAAKSCRFVLHEARATIQGEFNSTKLSELSRITKRITDDYISVISQVTSKKPTAIKKMVAEGTALSAEEAKKESIITEIIDRPYIPSGINVQIAMINNPQPPLMNLPQARQVPVPTPPRSPNNQENKIEF